MKQNIQQAIFFDENNNYGKFFAKNGHRMRQVAIDEIEKFKHCHDLRRGFRLYVCEGCHQTKLLPFQCKSKFCPSCAVGESQRWSDLMANDIYDVLHRHVIFTIDDCLRPIFLKYKRKELLAGLMNEAAKIIQDFFGKQKMQCGIVAALHTFGSQLEFNPHVHMIVTMGGVTPQGDWKEYDFLPFKRLRVFWQNAVLKLIRRTLNVREKHDVQPLLQQAYNDHGEGFYVNAPQRSRTKIKGLLLYISRYMHRGPIALERIKMYDGEVVMFEYHDKRTNTKEHKIMTAEEYIGAMVRQIPDRNFKTIRRYGIYSRRLKTLMKIVVANSLEKVAKMVRNASELIKKNWSQRIYECFGENPLKCNRCGEYYEYMGLVALKNGYLEIVYANNSTARQYLKEEIKKIESEEFKIKQEEAKEQIFKTLRFSWEERARELHMP
jgi:hypothetical protein